MATPPRTVLAMAEATANRLFDAATWDRLQALTRVGWWTEPFGSSSSAGGRDAREVLADAEILLTAWGSPPVDAGVLAAAPRLRGLFHGGGTVRRVVTEATWEHGIVVVSAAEANAIPVAEFTLASILYAGKRVPSVARAYRDLHGQGWEAGPWWQDRTASNHGRVVGLVGLSRIGRRVARLLAPFDYEVLAADPFADPALVGRELGVRVVGLEELVTRSDIVSLHAPSLPETRHLIDGPRLAAMRDGSTLINTARGALVDTEAMTKELTSGRIAAVLDVTDPEPLPVDSPLYDLPNVQLTPHIAGSVGTEVYRMGSLVVAELARYLSGEPLLHRVLREDMSRVA